MKDKFENIKTRINRKSRDRGDQEVFVAELQEMQETQVDNDAYDDNDRNYSFKRIQLKTNGFRRSGITNESIRS